MHPGSAAALRFHQYLLDGQVVALIVALHLGEQLETAAQLLLGRKQLLRFRRQALVFLVRLTLALGRASRGLVQRLQAVVFLIPYALRVLLGALEVGRHAAVLLRARGQGRKLAVDGLAQRGQARLLALHVAHVVHEANHALLRVLRLRFQARGGGFGLLQRAVERGLLLLARRNLLALAGNFALQRFDAAAHAGFALFGGALFVLHARLLAAGSRKALAQNVCLPLLRLDLLNQRLQAFAQLGGLFLALAQLILHVFAPLVQRLLLALVLRQRFAHILRRQAQFGDLLLIALAANQEHVQVEPLLLLAHGEVPARVLALGAQGLQPRLQLADDVRHARQVLLGVLQPLFGLQLAGFVFHNARRFLKHLPPVLALLGQDFAHAALPHDGIAVAPDAGVAEQIHNVLQAAGRAVEQVFALARAEHAARDGDLGVVGRQRVILVVERQRHLAVRHAAALFGAVENDVLHLGAAKLARALLA